LKYRRVNPGFLREFAFFSVSDKPVREIRCVRLTAAGIAVYLREMALSLLKSSGVQILRRNRRVISNEG
jgi:hypothetical protein